MYNRDAVRRPCGSCPVLSAGASGDDKVLGACNAVNTNFVRTPLTNGY